MICYLDSPRLLNTPPPPINNLDNAEDSIEDGVTIESLLSEDLMNSINSNSMSSNENLLCKYR